MPADYTALQAEIDALTAQVANTETEEASAVKAFQGFGDQVQKAVTDALTADNAADATSIAAASQAVAAVTARFVASASTLAAAIPATPAPPATT